MEQENKTDKLLEVRDLQVSFFTPAGEVKAVNGISYDVNYDEVMGIVGESGSGKSVEAYSIIGLLQNPGKVVGGSITFEGQDMLSKTKDEMIAFRGKEVAMIFQNPMTCLNPVYTIGNQLVEALKAHDKSVSKEDAEKHAMKMLEEVGINNVEKRMKQYPHELSGGMRQRVMIAMGLICHPKLLIADEPTTALDVTIQAQILELMKKLQKQNHMGIIFITHNLGVVAKIADYVNVMYAGKVVETGKAEDIFFDPRHPYTWGLLSSMPDLTGDKKERLYTIPGNPPNLANEVKGDAFAVRNPYALNIDFEEEPPMFEINEHHQAATWLLHPDAPKVEMPQTLKKRIEQLRREEKRYAETEGAYGTDE